MTINDIIAEFRPDPGQPGRLRRLPSNAWAANLNILARQAAEKDAGAAQQPAATRRRPREQVEAVFATSANRCRRRWRTCRDRVDMLKRYHGTSKTAGGATPRVPSIGAGRDDSSRTSASCYSRCRSTSRRRASPGSCPRRSGAPRPIPHGRQCHGHFTARFPRITRRTWCAARVTIHVSMCRASGRLLRRSAAATSRTCRWAPTRGTAIPTRF